MTHRIPCVHCKRRKGNTDRRSLCAVCYKDKDVRSRYESTHDRAQFGLGRDAPSRLPEPTECLPGSEEKLQVFIDRMRRKQHLFHPLDVGAFSGQEEWHPTEHRLRTGRGLLGEETTVTVEINEGIE